MSRKKEKHKNSDLNSKHPFWKATTGSYLYLISEDPKSGIKTMKITVHNISRPTVYKIEVNTSNTMLDSIVYEYKKETLNIITNGWMPYYKNKTKIIFKEFKNITEELYNKFELDKEEILDSNDDSFFHSNTSSITSSSSSSSITSSSESIISPRSSRKTDVTRRSMSLEPSPRKIKTYTRRGSLGSSPRSNLNYSKPESSCENSSNENSSNNSPRETETRSPRTPRLLERVSLKLALKMSPKKESPRSQSKDSDRLYSPKDSPNISRIKQNSDRSHQSASPVNLPRGSNSAR